MQAPWILIIYSYFEDPRAGNVKNDDFSPVPGLWGRVIKAVWIWHVKTMLMKILLSIFGISYFSYCEEYPVPGGRVLIECLIHNLQSLQPDGLEIIINAFLIIDVACKKILLNVWDQLIIQTSIKHSRKGLASSMYNLQGMILNHLKNLGALTSRPW